MFRQAVFLDNFFSPKLTTKKVNTVKLIYFYGFNRKAPKRLGP